MLFEKVTMRARLYISQVKRGSGEPFRVLDANAEVDGEAALMLGDGYYSVWIAALGKPGGSTNGDVSISGMVNLGTLQVERAKGTPNRGGYYDHPFKRLLGCDSCDYR